jgi:hypothetical protein
LLVWGWRRIGGESELWLRSLSVIFGVATVAALYGFTRDLFGRAPALLAALLLALHRTHVYYSQELRSYGLLWLLYILALWAAWRFVRDGGVRSAVGYVLAATAALYTHYQSGFVLASVALWGGLVLGRSPRRLGAWLGLHVAIAALLLPQVSTVLFQLRQHQGAHWAPVPHFVDLMNLLRTYAFGMRLLALPALALTLLPLARRAEHLPASLLWCFALPVIVFSYLLSQHDAHLFTERYMDFAIPAWCALLGAGAAGLRWKPVAIGVALALGGLAAYSLARHQPLEEPRDLRLAEQHLAARAQPGDVLIHADTHSLLYFVQHEPGITGQRLLIVGPRLPYYEALGVIPDSLFVSPREFERLRAARIRWWGVRTHHAGFDSRPALDTLRAHAAAIRHFGPLVTVIEGGVDSTRR